MLDQPETITNYDKSNALGVIEHLPEQLSYQFPATAGLSHDTITSVVLTGMGGSAQGGEFIKTWLGDRLPLPFTIVRGYKLPAFIGASTLVIVASYSGNTEESLSALTDAEDRGARIVVIAAGGKLQERAQIKQHPLYVLPGGLQPRFAVLAAVRAMVLILERVNLLSGASDELAACSPWLAAQLSGWMAPVPTESNPAKQIASAVAGHPIVVYAGPVLSFAAMKWKIACNENAKNIAFYNYFPEFNHNEFLGWLNPRPNGLKVIELRSDLDHPRVQLRFDVTNKLLAEAFAPIEIQAGGETALHQLLWTIALGEYVATYLAILNKVDPTPVELIEQFKHDLE